ncbi:MAG TPA: hypothetical protein PK843_09650 [bacterium]|nr:hypothetical protein [bacterium]
MKTQRSAGRAFARGVQRPRRSRVLRLQLRRTHVLWLLAFAAVIFLKVWQKTFIDHMNRRNGVWADELKLLRYENLLLEAKIEELRSLERISQIARDQYHMMEVPKIKLQKKNAFERLTDRFSNDVGRGSGR